MLFACLLVCSFVSCTVAHGFDFNSLFLQLKRRADHFLFSVESVGSMAPETVVREVNKPHFLYCIEENVRSFPC